VAFLSLAVDQMFSGDIEATLYGADGREVATFTDRTEEGRTLIGAFIAAGHNRPTHHIRGKDGEHLIYQILPSVRGQNPNIPII
jgi:hypothetical protein